MNLNHQAISTKSRASLPITFLVALGVGALCEHSLIGREWWTINTAAYIGELLGGALLAGALAFFPIFIVQNLLVQVSDSRNQRWPKTIIPTIVIMTLIGVFAYDTAKLYLPYSGSARGAAIQEMTGGCLATVQSSLPDATDQQRHDYCTCLSNTVIDKFTPQELRALSEPSNDEKLRTILASYAKDCSSKGAR